MSGEPKDSGKLGMTSMLLAAIGVVFLVSGAVSLQRERAHRSWPSVEGRITAAEVIAETTEHSNAASGRRSTWTHYRPAVVYEYTVEGRALRGDRITRFDSARPEQAEAEEIVQRYAVGSPVQVYYDAQSPEAAVLEEGVSSAAYSPLGLGGLLLLVAGGMRLAARS